MEETNTMSLLRFLGLGGRNSGRGAEPSSLVEIGKSLDELPQEEARLIAAFAYLLARVAGADLRTGTEERASLSKRLETFGGIDAALAGRLTDTAIHAAEAHGASDDHLVARAFRDMSDHSERLRLMRCLYAIAAADDTITTVEDNEIFEIAAAVGVEREDVIALRAEWKEYLGTRRALPGER
jgi:uncharacterized tellurite resistance protein B-like protein